MGEKNNKKIKISKRDILLFNLKYGWEFLRRREEYRSDFLGAVSSQKKVLSRKDFTLAEQADFNDIATYKANKEAEECFKKRYSLGLLLNPDIPFDYLGLGRLSDCQKNQEDWSWQLRTQLFKEFAFGRTGFGFEMGIHPYAVSLLTKKPWNDDFSLVQNNAPQFFNTDGEPLKPKDMPDKISLEVDLQYPLEIIKPALEAQVSKFKNMRKHLGIDKYEQRTRYDKYENYLWIYDLHTQRKTLREIARIVYPEEYEKLLKYKSRSEKYAVLPVTEKVNNSLKACQKLIDGGYKIIR